eukprot:12428638-Karenia_brevis.AAC.3
MTKAVAVKGMAAKALQPAMSGPKVAKMASAKAPRGLLAIAGKAYPKAVAGKATRRAKQTVVELQNAVADASGLPPKDVKKLLEALCNAASKSLRDTNVFKLHGMVLIRMRKTPPRSAVSRKYVW